MSIATPKLEIKSFQEIIGLFRIPSFQRGYRWERKQVEQLLNDIVNSRENTYYLQPVVLAPVSPQEFSKTAPDYEEQKAKLRAQINEEKEILEETNKNELKNLDLDATGNLLYDVIDGQQRLTTLYLIIQFFKECEKISNNDFDETDEIDRETLKKKIEMLKKIGNLGNQLQDDPVFCNYQLFYQTRNSSDFLENIANVKEGDPSITSTPDNLYLWHSYKIIESWAYNGKNSSNLNKLADSLKRKVRIIWYELPTSVTTWKKFTDLNVGKIPLTNSELVKALLMKSSHKEITDDEKSIIIQQWDEVEKELNDPNFWGFLTHKDIKKFDTKIDLLFDIVAKKPKDNTDDYFTFNHFDELYAGDDAPKGKEKWNDIYWKYKRIRDWYTDRELYHKIGFLSLVDGKDIIFSELLDFVTTKDEKTETFPTNGDFRKLLEKKISEVIKLPADLQRIDNLVYQTPEGSEKYQKYIKILLTFYNVIYTNDKTHQRYDFAAHKGINGVWSLEHIHAQNSEGLTLKEQQYEWLKNHVESIDRYLEQNYARIDDAGISDEIKQLKADMEMYVGNAPLKEINDTDFNTLARRFAGLIIHAKDEEAYKAEYTHELGNMALLNTIENAAFNNSTFDVKRHIMIRDMADNHIPICTQRVFLKSIPHCDDNHPYFWGEEDRKSYIEDIRAILAEYMPKIESQKEDNDYEQ